MDNLTWMLIAVGVGILLYFGDKLRKLLPFFKDASWKKIGVTLGVGGSVLLLMSYAVIPNYFTSFTGIPLAVGGSGSSGNNQATPTNNGGSISLKTACPDNRQSTARISLQDELATTLTFVGSSTIYLFDGNGERLTGTSGSSGFDANVTVTCPTDYRIVAVTQRGVASDSGEITRRTNLANEFVELKTVRISPVHIRVKDLVSDSYQTLFEHGRTTTGNGTNFTLANDTRVYTAIGGEASNFTVGADGSIDLEIYIKSLVSNRAVGGKNPYWACVDLNSGSTGTVNWQEPIVDFDGKRLSNTKGSLDSDSLTGSLVALSEACYKLADLGSDIRDTQHVLRTKFVARSGANPSTTDDIKVSLLSSGKYYSSRVANSIKLGIYDDAGTQATVVSPADTEPSLVINVQ